MDIFAHLFWTFIIFYGCRRFKLASLMGIIPDLLSWGIYVLYNLMNGISFGRPELDAIPNWVFTLYGITHSLFIFLAVFGIVYLVTKSFPVYLLPWLLHILIDIPTHQRSFLPTPFLWPLSSWRFPGISWGNPYFMLVNYILIITFLFLTLKYKKNIFLMMKEKFKAS